MTPGGACAMTHRHDRDLPHHSVYIDGQWTDAATGASMPVNEPALDQPMAYVARSTAADVDRAVVPARAAFDRGPWPPTPPQERPRILQVIAAAVEERSNEFAELSRATWVRHCARPCSWTCHGRSSTCAPSLSWLAARPTSRYPGSTCP